jgi:cysteate synthase
MRLYPSQNEPFTIMYDSWKLHSRQLVDMSPDDARKAAAEIDAKVLSNRRPPYSLAGGLYDALKATGGDIETVTNEELRAASEMFEKLEGIDINPAAAVAVCSLKKALESGKISKDETVMLNITGGGEKRFKSENDFLQAEPDLVIAATEDSSVIIEKVLELFK